MLSSLENKVMGVLIKECKEKPSILISPLDLMKMCNQEKLTASKIEQIINDLFVDGYFDLIYSDRRGERVYCITLTEKGKGYMRGKKVFKRNLVFRLGLTIVLAILSFIIGLILRAIF